VEDNAFIFEALAGVILCAVGLRVLELAFCTSGKHERLLGTHLLLSGTSYALYSIRSGARQLRDPGSRDGLARILRTEVLLQLDRERGSVRSFWKRNLTDVRRSI
jgi:hypothetical protein